MKNYFTLDYSRRPWGLKWRSSRLFIMVAVGLGLFTDMFLYGLAVPVLPFILTDRVHVPYNQIQSLTSWLLAAYAAASVVCSPLCGIVADRTSSRQAPFLIGITALVLSTALLFAGTTVWVLAVARLLQGASGAVVWTVGLALLVDTVGPENLGTAIGSIFSLMSFGGLFAPVLGGIMYKKTGVWSVAALSFALLAIDFIARVLVIEKKVLARYDEAAAAALGPDTSQGTSDPDPTSNTEQNDNDSVEPPTETTSLLTKSATPSHTPNYNTASAAAPSTSNKDDTPDDNPLDNTDYALPAHDALPWYQRQYPIITAVLRSPSLSMAVALALSQSFFFGAFDSTITLEAEDLFDFDSLKAGLLFAPLGLFDLIVGPAGGWAVDRFGTKPIAVIAYGYMAATLVLLRLPHAALPHGSPQENRQIALFAGLLAFCGIGVSLTGAPALVESSLVVERFHKRNPGWFGEAGPYAQMYGLNSMVFCLGLTIGPIVAGWLRETIGYGNMEAVVAVVCGVTALACLKWLGGPPRWRRKGWLITLKGNGAKKSAADPESAP